MYLCIEQIQYIMKPRKKSYPKKHVYTQDHSCLLKLFKEMDKKDAKKLAQ